MKLIVGLGNPGKEYEKTRHNVGFRIIDRLFSDTVFKFEKKFESEVAKVGEVILVRPQTFMNESGKAVRKIRDFYKVELDDLYVIHDDLDIRLGDYKIQKGKGPKVHNGVNDIEEKLGTMDFWRVRVGVDNRSSEGRESGDKYVLAKFEPEEEILIEEIAKRVMTELKSLIL